MAAFDPFSDDSASLTIGELTLENSEDQISLYGTLNITRDKHGLEQANKLLSVLDDTVKKMKADKSLPDTAKISEKPKNVPNPFG